MDDADEYRTHLMDEITATVDVRVPVANAYNQWTQFEEFPKFMDGVESVTQLDDTHLHWVAEIAGVRREWDAEITEQHPDQRIAWKATDGTANAGVVTFHRLDDESTRLALQLDVETEGMVEAIGEKLGLIKRRAAAVGALQGDDRGAGYGERGLARNR